MNIEYKQLDRQFMNSGKKPTGISNGDIMLLVVVAISLGAFVIWYFFFRRGDDTSPSLSPDISFEITSASSLMKIKINDNHRWKMNPDTNQPMGSGGTMVPNRIHAYDSMAAARGPVGTMACVEACNDSIKCGFALHWESLATCYLYEGPAHSCDEGYWSDLLNSTTYKQLYDSTLWESTREHPNFEAYYKTKDMTRSAIEYTSNVMRWETRTRRGDCVSVVNDDMANLLATKSGSTITLQPTDWSHIDVSNIEQNVCIMKNDIYYTLVTDVNELDVVHCTDPIDYT